MTLALKLMQGAGFVAMCYGMFLAIERDIDFPFWLLVGGVTYGIGRVALWLKAK